MSGKILGLDGGTATSGWAILDATTHTFEDLGVVIQPKRDKERTVTLERQRRANNQARVIAAKAPGCSLIAVEQLSLGIKGKIAVLSMGLSWGIILGAVAQLEALGNPRPRLLTIAPKRWQNEVLPSGQNETDYEELARRVGAHLLRRHPKAYAALQRIPEKHQNHAIDAAMIALVGALRPHRCDAIGETQEAA